MSSPRRFGLAAAFLAAGVMAFGLSVGRLELTPTDSQDIWKDATGSGPAAKSLSPSVAILLAPQPWPAELRAAGWLEDSSESSPVEFSVLFHSPRSPPQFVA